MGWNYQRLAELVIDHCAKQSPGRKVHRKNLEKAIMEVSGIVLEKTINSFLARMGAMGYIKPTDNPAIFEILKR